MLVSRRRVWSADGSDRVPVRFMIRIALYIGDHIFGGTSKVT